MPLGHLLTRPIKILEVVVVAIAAAEDEEVGRNSAICQVCFKILPHTTKVVLLKEKQRRVTELELGLLATVSLPYKFWDHSCCCLSYKQIPYILCNFKYHAPKSIKHFQDYAFLNFFGRDVTAIHYLDHTILTNRISGHKNVFS